MSDLHDEIGKFADALNEGYQAHDWWTGVGGGGREPGDGGDAGAISISFQRGRPPAPSRETRLVVRAVRDHDGVLRLAARTFTWGDDERSAGTWADEMRAWENELRKRYADVGD